MSASDQTPLPADKRRQADAMLRGCEYQIWQTVNAWFDLRPTEQLFVEGAEDFDVIGGETAHAVQIKAGEEVISLGRADAREALNNFWTLRSAAPHQQIYFRFLTRSQFGVERGHPFGSGVAGLDLWMKPRLSDPEVLLIRDFLVAQNTLLEPFQQWLAAATPAGLKWAQSGRRALWCQNRAGLRAKPLPAKRRLSGRACIGAAAT